MKNRIMHKALLSTHAQRRIVIAAAISLLAGCAVGPDYKRPELTPSKSFSPTPLPAETTASSAAGGNAQRFVVAQDIPVSYTHLTLPTICSV